VVGERRQIEVEAFEWDDNEEHLARHGLTLEVVEQVRDNAPRFFANLPGRTASHVMIGPDLSGSFCYVAIMATARPGVWPITGWRLGRRAPRLYNST
jgi:hypothetical protein